MENKELTLDESVVKALEIFEARQSEKDAEKAKEEVALEQAAKAQKYDEMIKD